METVHERKNQFYIGANEEEPVGQLRFHIEGERLIIEHVYIAKALRGNQLGVKLVEKAVEHARINDLVIISHCSYAETVLLENKSYRDIYKSN